MKNIWRLYRLVPRYKSRLFWILLLSSIVGAVNVVVPYLFKLIIDHIVSISQSANLNAPAEQTQVWWLLAILAGARLLSAATDYLNERQIDQLYLDVKTGLRLRLFSHLSRLSIDYYEKTKIGEIIEKLQTGILELSNWTMRVTEGSLVNLITIVFILAVLLLRLPLVGLIMAITIPLYLYYTLSKTRRQAPLRRQWLKLAEQAGGELTESLTHMSTVRSFAQEGYKLDRYSHLTEQHRIWRLRGFRIDWQTNFLRELASSTGILLSSAIVIWGVFRGRNTPGDVILVTFYTQQIIGQIKPIGRLLSLTNEVDTSAERLAGILDVKPTVVDKPDAVELTNLESIEFNNVSFCYPGKRQPVLKNVSFKLDAGQTLALVGPSGTGKTTITKLLLRFYDPTSGRILINGQDYRIYKQESLRRHIGMVMQDVALFNDSIEENIHFANPAASLAEVEAAATSAHADVFIDRLPQKYKTLVGERGIKLSGGEKQRVAIARAILKNPQLIILDEATSALDSQSERFVQDGLAKLLAGRTVIVIAHRLSTIMQADLILVLKDGKIVEQGSHQQLLNLSSGLYSELYRLQASGMLEPEL
jgi:ABC-type multidrug transport system fused ATPase/permease subunit